MRYFNLDIYHYHKLNTEQQDMINQTNESVNQCIQVGHYRRALKILEEASIQFQEMGIYSSIYYRIASMKNRISDIGKDASENRSKQMLFDVYQECYVKKDYRNAVRMLRYYEALGEDELKVVPLNLAKVYTKLGDFKKAKKYLEDCKDIQYENPHYIAILLEILYKQKKFDSVIRLLPKLEKYDGRSTWEEYILVAKACLILGKENKARNLYMIAKEIAHGREKVLYKIEESKTSIDYEKKRHYPTKTNLAILFQIACDEENVEDAESYLNQLLCRPGTEELLEIDQEKIKKLGELKEKYKEVNSN